MPGLIWSQSIINLAPVVGFPNEPGGYTIIRDEPWDAVPNNGSTPINGWAWEASDAALAVGVDAAAPYSPSNYLSVKFPSGMNGNGAPCRVTRSFSAGEQFHNLFVGTYFQMSSNFAFNNIAGCKWMWPSSDQSFGAANYLNFDGSNMEMGLAQQGTPDRILGPNNGNDSVARFISYLGIWRRVEMWLKGNSANGSANGEFHVWIDGVKTHQYTDVNYNMSAARKFLDFRIEPTYGGGAGPVPADMYFRWDHLRLSGSA